MKERDMDVFNLYESIVNDEFVHRTLSELEVCHRNRIYSCGLVMWLMIFQRLDRAHSLSSIVDQVREGTFDSLLPTKKGALISSNTGGYAQARSRVPLELVKRSADSINEALIGLHKEQRWHDYKVFLIDGSTWTLQGTEDIKATYTPCTNQYGESHGTKVRTLHAHDLLTGVALRPEFGPMYGSKAVGEVTLLPKLLSRLPRNSVLVADRLYGSFKTAHLLAENNLKCLFRLQTDRAGRFLKELKKPGELVVEWSPSAHEMRKYPDLAQDTFVAGRFVWYRAKRKGYKTQDLYFFTTLPSSIPAKEIAELYSLRWNIETDLRSIKTTMDLVRIESKSADIVAKEIILGHVAYNLVRNVMAVAGQLAKVDPRSLSFAKIMYFVIAAAPKLLTDSHKDRKKRFARLVRDIHQYQLPKRKSRRPTEPRKILFRKRRYPLLKLPREIEREMLEIKRLAA